MAFVVRVWDLPTRCFHWTLVLCVTGLLISGSLGGAAMEWHFRFGYGVATLLLFRTLWGFVGGYWSRFSSFFYAPKQVLRYLQGSFSSEKHTGHNPLGALSVYAMLFFLIFQVASGLMSNDEIAAAGPLVRHVAGSWVSYATFYHKQIGKIVLLGLISLHLGAIAFHFFARHDNLVQPMLTGDKLLLNETAASVDSAKQRWLAIFVFLICSAGVASLIYWLEK